MVCYTRYEQDWLRKEQERASKQRDSWSDAMLGKTQPNPEHRQPGVADIITRLWTRDSGKEQESNNVSTS